MPSPTTVLLPDVFDPKVIGLGYILRNPLEPTIQKFVPSQETLQQVTTELSEVETKHFHATLSLDKRGSFSINFARLLGTAASTSHTNYLAVQAEKLKEQCFPEADAALVKICRGEDARLEEWIRPFARLRKPVYFVAGIQTLHKATFKRAVGSDGAVEGYASLPLDGVSAEMLPVNVRAQMTRRGSGTSGGTVSGVFGVKVMKGTWSIFHAEEKPRWEGRPYWTWVYETKGGADVEKLTGLEMQELSEEDLEELQRERWADEEEDDEGDDDDEI